MQHGSALRPGLGQGRGRHDFQAGNTKQWLVQSQAQPAHEGQAHALAGESAWPHRDGEAIQRGEIVTRHRRRHHRRQGFGMAALCMDSGEMMGKDFLAPQQRHRTGAQTGIDGQ